MHYFTASDVYDCGYATVRLSGNCFTLNRLIPSSNPRSVKLVRAFARFPYVARWITSQTERRCIHILRDRENGRKNEEERQEGGERVISREWGARKAGHVDRTTYEETACRYRARIATISPRPPSAVFLSVEPICGCKRQQSLEKPIGSCHYRRQRVPPIGCAIRAFIAVR